MLRICNRGLAYFLFKTLFNYFLGGWVPPTQKQLPTRSKLQKLKLESWVAAGMYKDLTVVLVGL